MTVQYQKLLKKIISHGVDKGDRTGTGTRSLFGPQMEFDLREGFPLLTTKKLWWRAIVEELLWMLSGSTDAKVLQDKGITIWDEWATAEKCAEFGREEGDLGPIYGSLWRNFGYIGKDTFYDNGIDQIAGIVKQLLETPDSRRIILTGWDPRRCTKVALPPCHTLAQFYVADGRLSCKMFQRSADVFLGVPYNTASYALLTHMLAWTCDLQPGRLVHTFGDVHIYNNHQEQVAEQLDRTPRELPRLTVLRKTVLEGETAFESLLGLRFKDFQLLGYEPDAAIKAPVAV